MNYKLISEPNPLYSSFQQVFVNRGISTKDIDEYINVSEDNLNDPNLLENELLEQAMKKIVNSIKNNTKACIIVDADCDGFTSSAIFLNYFNKIFPTWGRTIAWYIHSGKQHGLSDCVDEIIEKNFDLVIVPDGGTNDIQEHKKLYDNGIDVVILDHHELEEDIDVMTYKYATIINNQTCGYPNKFFSGAGIVFQFCRYVDRLLDKDAAVDVMDLVALGNVADMMSLKELETRYVIKEGFKDGNIKNPFIAYMAKANEFSLKGKITPTGAAFYLAPFVNAMVRSGTYEEKNLLFKSMLNYCAFEKVLSTKRGHKLGEQELLVEQAVRVCKNVKARQTKSEKEGMSLLEDTINLNNKVVLFLLEPGQIESNIAGLVANKIMAKYQRPVCVLTKTQDEQNNILYQGSARGCDLTGITEFKDICESTGLTTFVAGHQGAFGIGLNAKNIEQFLESTNTILKDAPDEAIYRVDFIFNENNLDEDIILKIADMEEFWGKDFAEPMIAIENVKITQDNVRIMGLEKGHPTLKIMLPNGMSIIKFNSSEDEYNELVENDCLVNLVGKCSSNTWNGKTSGQIKLVEYQKIEAPVLKNNSGYFIGF